MPLSIQEQAAMSVYCPNCQEKARITSRNNLTERKTVVDLYCECKNPLCQARFVETKSFTRWINPPANSTLQLAANLLNTLSKDERNKLLNGISPP
ncbi:ogr/Delta-like zinc finger family protein [Methylomonas sp. WH-1]|uniref:ogr/Delta-like zinc finger family protein n=1 Tax=unclassified Methylomonas TaxID=2608980 RepID=UPI00068C0516|nr:ogr/Delta-like zinc finger family protein [Methylomonas sp. LW13]